MKMLNSKSLLQSLLIISLNVHNTAHAIVGNSGIEVGKEALQSLPYKQGVQTVGYLTGAKYMAESYYADSTVEQVFNAQAGLLNSMPVTLPSAFDVIIEPLAQYIQNIRRAQTDTKELGGGISTEKEIAEKITRAAFCFQFDPKMMAAMLHKETKFNNRMADREGTGMTQMTSAGIDEIYDQWGGRGNNAAPASNIEFLNKAIDCYIGENNSLEKLFWSKMGKNIQPNKLNSVQIKRMILGNFDLDIVFGASHLKGDLSRAKTANPRARMMDLYRVAMMNYNGNNSQNGAFKRNYAAAVLSIFGQIAAATKP